MSFQISGLGHVRQPKVLDLTYDPVGLWRFDGSLTDLSPTGDDLSVDNGSLLYAASHEFGNRAAYFKDNQLRLRGNNPAPAPLVITGDVTVQLVVFFNQTVGVDSFGTQLIGLASAGGSGAEVNNDLYTLFLNNVSGQMVPRFTWEYGTGSRESITGTGYNLGLGQWYHLVGVRESTGGSLSTGSLYLNGQLIAETTSLNDATGGASSSLWLGRDPNNAGLGYLGGTVSSAKINNRALTAREIKYEWLRVSGEYAGDRL